MDKFKVLSKASQYNGKLWKLSMNKFKVLSKIFTKAAKICINEP